MLIVCMLSAKQGTLYLFIFIFKAILANPYHKVSLVSNTGAKVSGFFGLREDTRTILEAIVSFFLPEMTN